MKEMVYSVDYKIEVLFSGQFRGHKFCILNLGTHPTAYVECKFKNMSSYDDERLDKVQVHGGFTYLNTSYWDKDPTLFLGWDYAHCYDYKGYEIKFRPSLRTNDKKWTTHEIFEEVKSVIEQLIPLEESEDTQ